MGACSGHGAPRHHANRGPLKGDRQGKRGLLLLHEVDAGTYVPMLLKRQRERIVRGYSLWRSFARESAPGPRPLQRTIRREEPWNPGDSVSR